MSKNPYNQYKKSSIQTASQGKLILMMYDGAIKFLNLAVENISNKRYDIVNVNIIKTQDIITELMLALNLEVGGDIAKNLYSLYDYMNRRLVEANIKKNSEVAKEVLKLLTELKEAWEIVVRKTNEAQQTKYIQKTFENQEIDRNAPGSGGINFSG
ncbi:flagellar export chaperone FliS [Candidatus Dependentiae bacterium]|nr:flagellar export chaperone FliS [Candidatus Dependentiae bacterium]